MTLRRAWFLLITALFVATVAAFLYRVNVAHSEPINPPTAEIEPTAEDYEMLCGLKEVECQNERTVIVTGYTSRVEETDSTPCIGAYGHDICKRLRQGLQTCASNDFPRGTILHVEGLGDCTVLDRMSTRYTGTGRVDWYFGYDFKAARAWGVKNAEITIIY